MPRMGNQDKDRLGTNFQNTQASTSRNMGFDDYGGDAAKKKAEEAAKEKEKWWDGALYMFLASEASCGEWISYLKRKTNEAN